MEISDIWGSHSSVAKVQNFWGVTLCDWAHISRRFEGSFCRHLESKAV